MYYSFTSKMSVDLFGRSLDRTSKSVCRGPPGVGYKLTETGHYDVENRKICNLAFPSDSQDAVNFDALQVNTNKTWEHFEKLNSQQAETIELLKNRIEKLEKNLDDLRKFRKKPIINFNEIQSKV